MARLAKCLKVVDNAHGGRSIFVDTDEFPWCTADSVEKVEPYPGTDEVSLVTVRIVVNGPVTFE